MFVNRGMIESAHAEGESPVMAHEISHVVPRHGTAQQSRAGKYQVGAILGRIAGAVLGGVAGEAVAGAHSSDSAPPFSVSRATSRSRPISRACRSLPRRATTRATSPACSRRLSRKAGGRPGMAERPPNPANRVAYIIDEASRVTIQNPVRDTQAFDHFARTSSSCPERHRPREPSKPRHSPPTATPLELEGRSPQSTSYRSYPEGNLFRVAVPANWRELADNTSVTFAPDGAFGQGIFTHGVQIGIGRHESHGLLDATEELIASLSQGNPGMTRSNSFDRVVIVRRGSAAHGSGQSDARRRARNESVLLHDRAPQRQPVLHRRGRARGRVPLVSRRVRPRDCLNPVERLTVAAIASSRRGSTPVRFARLVHLGAGAHLACQPA